MSGIPPACPSRTLRSTCMLLLLPLAFLVAVASRPGHAAARSAGKPAAALPVGAASVPTGYTVTLIPNLTAGEFGMHLNNHGQVAGLVYEELGPALHLWNPSAPNSPNGQVKRIAAWPGGCYLNDYGQVAAMDGTLWTPATANGSTGTITQQALPGTVFAFNANGAMAGITEGEDNAELFLWSPAQPHGGEGQTRVLTSTGQSHQVFGLNAAGTLCGARSPYDTGGNERAISLRTAGGAAELTELPEPIQGINYYDRSLGQDINDAGEIVGYRTDLSGTAGWFHESVVWLPLGGGGYAKLEAPPGARKINNQGDLLTHSELWHRGASGDYVRSSALEQALAGAGFAGAELIDLNDAGQVLAIGTLSQSLVLLSPSDGRELKLFDANIDHTGGQELPVLAGQSLEPFTTPEWQESAEERPNIAADGVSLLLLRLRLPATATGSARFRVEENPAFGADPGSLWPVNAASLKDATPNGGTRDAAPDGPTQLDVPTVTINGGRWAFALYRAPRNFDPDASTWSAGLRNLIIRAGIPGEPLENTVTAPLTVVRPLVILQHGTFSGVDTWSNLPPWVQPGDGFTLWLNGAQSDNDYQYPAELLDRLPFFVARTSFERIYKAAGPLAHNAAYVLPQIQSLLTDWRKKMDIAGTQADVITHSYGGPTMRQVAQIEHLNGSGQAQPLTRSVGSFRRLQNWGHGYFHKLITIAGSHRGSAMTNHAARLNRHGKKIGGYAWIGNLKGVDKPTYLGAMRDQFVMSDALKALRESRCPSHAFVGSGTIDQGFTRYESVPFTGAYGVDQRGGPYQLAKTPFILRPPPLPSELNFPNLKRSSNYHFNLSYTKSSGPEGDPNYDLTVSSRSASAGLAKPFYSDINDLAGTNLAGKISHLLQTNNRLVSERMVFLLHQKTTSQYFTHFPPGSGPGSKPLDATETKLSNRTQYNPFWLVLGTPLDPTAASAATRALAPVSLPVLTSTAQGPDVCPGDRLTVSVAWPGKTIAVAQILWPMPGGGTQMELIGGSTPNLEIVVPALTPGRFGIAGLVTATDGSSESVDLGLEICDPNTYTELRTEPSELVLRDTQPTPLQVYGKLPGGGWRWLGNSSYTTLTSADPLTARVTTDHSVGPVKFGSTTVYAGHRGVTVDVPVTVEGTPVQVTAILAGRNPAIVRTSTRAVEFAFLSGTGFDARTVSPESVLIAGRLPEPLANGSLAAVKDVNRDGKPDLVFRAIPANLRLQPGSAKIRLLGATTGGMLVGGEATVTVR